MALQLSKSDMKHAGKRLQSLSHRIQSIKKKAEATTEKLLRTAETSGAAFAAGVIQGRTGGVELVGVPLELVFGGGLTIVGLFGGAGKHSDHLNNVGDGFLAAYATTLGRGVGATWLEKSGGTVTQQVTTPGQAQVAAPKVSGVRLSPEEIAATAREAAGL